MPTASWMSPFVTERIALDIILLTVSQMLIGHTPGFLFRAMSLHAMRDETLDGSTRHVQRRLAVAAKEWQSSSEADLKEVHNLHPMASKPDGPALPSVRRAASLMQRASRVEDHWVDRLRFTVHDGIY